MAAITPSLVKQLRDKTGAGMMECKKALDEANGDVAEAEVILRKRGIASAGKKSARVTRQGLVTSHLSDDGQLGVLLELNCESDFVARTGDFQTLVDSLAKIVAEKAPADVPALLSEAAPSGEGTVADVIKERIAKLGENIAVARFVRLEAPSTGVLGSYIHPGAQLGVMILAATTTPGAAAQHELQELVKDLAMHVAAADPQFIAREEVTAEVIDKEKEIARDRARAEGKPEKILDKIVEGRMAKYYEEVCLLEQPFIKDNAVSIADLVKTKGKAAGTVTVERFVRMKVGDTAPAEDQAAAE